jgi:endonuclease/exonuclease/phosphatase (EEP) superfamily protein YafD
MTETLGNAALGGAIALLGAATVLGFCQLWFLALLGHFRRHIAACALVLAPLALLAMWPLALKLAMGGAALAIGAFNIVSMRRVMPVSPSGARAGVTLRVAFANVHDISEEFGRLIDWVRAEKVDVLLACEVTPLGVSGLRALEPQLPYGHGLRPGEVMILSRLPLAEAQDDPSLSFARLASAEIATPAGPVQLVVVHPPAPRDTARAAMNLRTIAATGSVARKAEGGVIVAGDFNSTPWSPAFSAMVAHAGLAFGRGAREATWPTWLPAWLGLPLDHILVGGGCTIVERRHGPHTGSDHRPILADVRVHVAPG